MPALVNFQQPIPRNFLVDVSCSSSPLFLPPSTVARQGNYQSSMSFSSLFSRETSDLRHKCISLSQALERQKAEHNEAITSKGRALTSMESALSAVNQENLTFQACIVDLKKELQACKDDLFRLQPLSHVPDSTIAQRLEDLNIQICDWIAAEVLRSIDEHEEHDSQLKLFYHGGNRHAKAFLAEYPDFGREYYVRSVLQQHLQQVLFDDKILLFALDQGDSMFLQFIEHGMSRLEPSRGKHHCTV